MMTNNLKIIQEMSGFLPGKVFIRDNGNEPLIVTPYSGEKLFDSDSNNFHICPDGDWEAIALQYSDRRKKLRSSFEGFFNILANDNNYASDQYPHQFSITKKKTIKEIQDDPVYNFDTIYLNYGFGSKGGAKQLRVYRYLTFFYKGSWYRINFMRMYVDDNEVNCIMNELQYDKDTTDNGYYFNVGKDGGIDICYPSSHNDGSLGKNSAGNVAYNPYDASYSDILNDPQKIVNSFLTFVARFSKE